MSVLIKGMKMPEKCGSCDLFHVESPMHCTVVKGHKTVGAPYGMPRPDWCPLVEIPEPHGDLIDRDALEADILPEWNGLYVPDNAYSEKLICNAPTVIPREDGEKHDT